MRQKMQLRFVLAANIICPLLEVAAEAVALLHCGAAISMGQAIVMVARAGKDRCPLHRSLLPGGVATNADLILTAETLIQDQLRRESAPAESSNTQRGPPGIAA